MARMTVGRSNIGPEAYSDDTMLPPVERLNGLEVCDVAGERIGTVEDTYTDTEGSFVRYLAVKIGWLGTRRQMIPIDDVHIEYGSDDEPFLTVPYERDQMREGPAMDRDDELNRDDEAKIYGHYGRAGYWDAVRARQTPPAPTPEIAQAEVQAALDRGDNPNVVAVKRWGV